MKIARSRIPFLLAAVIGLFYALVARFILGEEYLNANGLLTGSFLCLTPIAIGAITAHYLPHASGWPRPHPAGAAQPAAPQHHPQLVRRAVDELRDEQNSEPDSDGAQAALRNGRSGG